MKENRRFNRREWDGSHVYDRNLGNSGRGTAHYKGYLKCKLVHTRGGSVIVPDQVFLTDGAELLWIQPLAFIANSIAKTPDAIECLLFVDISLGHTLEIHWKASGHVRSYADGSQLFRCTILGPNGLASMATGRANIDAENRVFINLYHHTSADRRTLIQKSRLLRGSAWNIQGTRQLDNVAYAYLTPLDRIVNKDDLHEIAMASEGILHLQPDNVLAPQFVDPSWIRQNPGKILELKVYRENTANRAASLKFSVEASILAPQHILRHDPQGMPVYYEINQPFVHRIGVAPGGGVRFNASRVLREQDGVKRFKYIVLGDATTLEGLEAPYDEENTPEIFKIESLPKGQEMLTFWMENANQDLYSGLAVELQKLGPYIDPV